MAINVRHGLFKDFDKNKMTLGELATSLDTKELYAAFAPGDVKKIATYEDMVSDIEKAQEDIIAGLTTGVNQVTQAVQTATKHANEQGDYAKTQGDYAKTEGDYAKAQGDAAKSIVLSKIATETEPGVIKSGGDLTIGSDGIATIKNKGVAGGIPTLDGSGKVPSSQLPAISTDASGIAYDGTLGVNVKLALDEVSSQLGEMENEKLAIGNDYRPNILINGDFKIWQRGVSFVADTGKYTADRWYFGGATGDSSITIAKVDTGAKIITSAANSIYLMQTIENSSYLFEKAITISCSINGTVYKLSGVVSATNLILNIPDYGLFYTEYNNSTNLLKAVFLIPTNKNVVINWVKLELNDHATPFIPRSYAEELRDCQRYFEKYEGLHRFRNITSNANSMVEIGAVSYKAVKRINPTVIFKYNINGGDTLTATANLAGQYSFTDNSVSIPANSFLDIRSWTADAEL